MHWTPDTTWGGLQHPLMEGQWHVQHFTVHGIFDSGRDEEMLALTREDGPCGPGPSEQDSGPGRAVDRHGATIASLVVHTLFEPFRLAEANAGAKRSECP